MESVIIKGILEDELERNKRMLLKPPTFALLLTVLPVHK